MRQRFAVLVIHAVRGICYQFAAQHIWRKDGMTAVVAIEDGEAVDLRTALRAKLLSIINSDALLLRTQ